MRRRGLDPRRAPSSRSLALRSCVCVNALKASSRQFMGGFHGQTAACRLGNQENQVVVRCCGLTSDRKAARTVCTSHHTLSAAFLLARVLEALVSNVRVQTPKHCPRTSRCACKRAMPYSPRTPPGLTQCASVLSGVSRMLGEENASRTNLSAFPKELVLLPIASSIKEVKRRDNCVVKIKVHLQVLSVNFPLGNTRVHCSKERVSFFPALYARQDVCGSLDCSLRQLEDTAADAAPIELNLTHRETGSAYVCDGGQAGLQARRQRMLCQGLLTSLTMIILKIQVLISSLREKRTNTRASTLLSRKRSYTERFKLPSRTYPGSPLTSATLARR